MQTKVIFLDGGPSNGAYIEVPAHTDTWEFFVHDHTLIQKGWPEEEVKVDFLRKYYKKTSKLLPNNIEVFAYIDLGQIKTTDNATNTEGVKTGEV